MITSAPMGRQAANIACGGVDYHARTRRRDQMKKPKWVVEKEQSKKAAAAETVWLFGLHAVRDALLNPRARKAAPDRHDECLRQAGRRDRRTA